MPAQISEADLSQVDFSQAKLSNSLFYGAILNINQLQQCQIEDISILEDNKKYKFILTLDKNLDKEDLTKIIGQSFLDEKIDINALEIKDNFAVLEIEQKNEFAVLLYSGKISNCVAVQIIQKSEKFSLAEIASLTKNLQKHIAPDFFANYSDFEPVDANDYFRIVKEMIKEELIISFLQKLKEKDFDFVHVWLEQKT